jgi:hypothetical protein
MRCGLLDCKVDHRTVEDAEIHKAATEEKARKDAVLERIRAHYNRGYSRRALEEIADSLERMRRATRQDDGERACRCRSALPEAHVRTCPLYGHKKKEPR